jgi:hypothetical protein
MAPTYVWMTPLGNQKVSPHFDTAEEAGEWKRSSEGQRVTAASMFPLKLRAISDGNWSRDATGAEKLAAGVI